MLLKRELGPKSWPLEAVVGVVWRRRGNESLDAASWLQFREKSAWIWLQISLQEGHDFRHKRPRSRRDRASIVLQMLQEMTIESRGIDPTRKDPRSRLDRTTIVVFFHASPTPSDWNPTLQIPAKRERKPVFIVAVGWRLDRDPHGAPIVRDRVRLMKIHRSWWLHVRRKGRERSRPSDENRMIA